MAHARSIGGEFAGPILSTPKKDASLSLYASWESKSDATDAVEGDIWESPRNLAMPVFRPAEG